MAEDNPDILTISIGSQELGIDQGGLETVLGLVIDLAEGPLSGVAIPVIDLLLNSPLGGFLGGALEATWAARDGVLYDDSDAFGEQNPLFAKFAAAGDGHPQPVDPQTQSVIDGISSFVSGLSESAGGSIPMGAALDSLLAASAA